VSKAPEIIELPFAIPTRNKLDKMHWAEKKRLRGQYQLFVRNQMKLNKIHKADPGSECTISIVTFRKYPIRDYDNLVGGCKQLLDALSHEGFIWDDSIKYIGSPAISQHKSKEEYTIVSRVLPIPSK
tara:strand:- start:754 stop:1134 length:381 start_codon:yes stop_codon:yes gene_type:complete